jgi:hypothetical protein
VVVVVLGWHFSERLLFLVPSSGGFDETLEFLEAEAQRLSS